MKFEVVSTDKGLKFYKRIKGFLGKEKLKEAKHEEIFAPMMKSGNLFPDIKNLPLDDILLLKQEYNMKNHTSDFGCEVDFKINKFEDKLIKTKDGFCGFIKFDGIVKNSEENKDICSFTINTRIINSDFKPTKKFYEALFANTYSGVYGSLKKVDELYDSMNIENRWVCEECGKEFKNRLEFLSHLIETKHYDSIFEEYLYDKDVLFVKNQIKREKIC